MTSAFGEDHAPAPWWSWHAQATGVVQAHEDIRSPYAGSNSLDDEDEAKETATATLFLGARLWDGAALYANPEVAEGFGLSGTLGIAGFPNGEATKVGSSTPRLYLARLFLRQDLDLGGAPEPVADEPNQLAAQRSDRRITITLGTLAATDIFDDNAYSHDTRTQFLNWSLMESAAWDFPADARGYTTGAALEYHDGRWATAVGAFLEPTEANGKHLDWRPWKQLGLVAQIEHHHEVAAGAGAIRVLGFANHALMGDYAEALDQPGTPDLGPTRRSSWKYGGAISADQALGGVLGGFTRLSWNDGRTETWAFTEVDRSAAVGLSASGAAWGRASDVVAIGEAINGLSPQHERFLARGGTGIIVGDGALSYRPEAITEAYYATSIVDGFTLSPDVQWVDHPGYNADRGPVWIIGLRAHWAR